MQEWLGWCAIRKWTFQDSSFSKKKEMIDYVPLFLFVLFTFQMYNLSSFNI